MVSEAAAEVVAAAELDEDEDVQESFSSLPQPTAVVPTSNATPIKPTVEACPIFIRIPSVAAPWSLSEYCKLDPELRTVER